MGSCKIYILAYKPVKYGIPEDSVLTPLQVGDKETFLKLRDNIGDNISSMNGLYVENTGTYWIWKNAPEVDYIGQMQYRRRFPFNEKTDFDKIFSKCEVIACRPLRGGKMTLREQYYCFHDKDDIILMEEIIKDKFPDLYEITEKILDSRMLYYSNGFVMRRDDYLDYCKFLFTILDEFRKRRGWVDMRSVYDSVIDDIRNGRRAHKVGVKYQSQVFGFLSERIWTIYLLSHFKTIYEVKYQLMENTRI